MTWCPFIALSFIGRFRDFKSAKNLNSHHASKHKQDSGREMDQDKGELREGEDGGVGGLFERAAITFGWTHFATLDKAIRTVRQKQDAEA